MQWRLCRFSCLGLHLELEEAKQSPQVCVHKHNIKKQQTPELDLSPPCSETGLLSLLAQQAGCVKTRVSVGEPPCWPQASSRVLSGRGVVVSSGCFTLPGTRVLWRGIQREVQALLRESLGREAMNGGDRVHTKLSENK